MSYFLGQNEIPSFTYQPATNGLTTPTANGTPWWQKAWGGFKEVLKTGTETFAAVAPYVFDGGRIPPITSPTTQLMKDPATGREQTVTYTPYTPGQTTAPGIQVVTLPSGQQVTRSIQRASALPPWTLPVGLAAGGFFLLNMLQKKR